MSPALPSRPIEHEKIDAKMDLETFWYEAFPYLCGLCGLFALLFAGRSILFMGSGSLLIAASLAIIHLRRRYRREMVGRIITSAEMARMPVHGD